MVGFRSGDCVAVVEVYLGLEVTADVVASGALVAKGDAGADVDHTVVVTEDAEVGLGSRPASEGYVVKQDNRHVSDFHAEGRRGIPGESATIALDLHAVNANRLTGDDDAFGDCGSVQDVDDG